MKALREIIDWTPFFQTWELAGRYPAILDDEVVGKEARTLLNDAEKMLDEIIEQNSFVARAVFGIYPARRRGDDVVVTRPEIDEVTFHFLRQQKRKADGPNYCLADFVQTSGDHLGLFAVSIHGADEMAAEFKKDHDDYHAIMAKALADRLAEALAEWLHREVRTKYWGYATQESLTNDELIKETYQGIRPAPGYPACPDHAAKDTIFEVLSATEAIGSSLTESWAINPASSVSGFYFGHPQARYFGVGKIERDQLQDYAARCGINIEEAEARLRTILT